MTDLVQQLLPAEWLKANLVFSLFVTWSLVGIFTYLNRFIQRHYFSLWTAGWVSYGLWLTSTIILLGVSNPAEWEWIKLLCMGAAALFMVWGTLHFGGISRGQWMAVLALFASILWSVLARRQFTETVWISLPLYWVLSLASFLASGYFFQKRFHTRFSGASVLGFGFGLSGILMAWHPFIENQGKFRAAGYFFASLVQLIVATGMLILVLEEIRGQTHSLREQVRADARLARRLQREIQSSEKKYAHLFANANDAILIVDPVNLQILEANRAAQVLTGYSHQELQFLGLGSLCAFLQEQTVEIAREPQIAQKLFSSYGNIPLQRKDGNVIMTEGLVSVAELPKGFALYVFLREVTERRRLEQQMRQIEKLSALGQLVSGVAHELNNPLAVINGFAQLLAMRPNLDEKTLKDLKKIQRESDRASRIVQNFLSFARKKPMEKGNVNLNKLLETILELLDYDMRASGIALLKQFHPNLPPIFADANQIEQVFINLINNGIQAMHGSTRPKQIAIETGETNGRVRVVIKDYGPGISPALLNRIFDPFFTTKGAGMGTGLGLSISHSIIREHSGTIHADNHQEGGARFTIELPISPISEKGRKTPGLKDSGITPISLSLSERLYQVLVVDDEPAILDVFIEFLTDHSCDVQGANNGAEALEAIRNKDFDLILCDLKMPVMDGQRFCHELQKIKPQLVHNLIFITGDTNSTKTIEFLQNSDIPWLAKPFNFREIETVLKEHFHNLRKKYKKNAHPASGHSNPPPN
ncbi:MAG: response regulator [Verrucomicrobiae bacterium]|nr:response regulator [Verrucomicrobiae bacterium]